ncbi:hypothetical protein [Paenibacillus mendelii]|uniref:Uncharacterized protein n=1 Tax=Paenibacillus mendelii TaxID=206163 RepID=A0ABV6J694_9BACL|nr:hypothetical protein [Paenibacillus mendelii]MCQ6559935.1 hypothetical protein [Paenibacillus mendelii]
MGAWKVDLLCQFYHDHHGIEVLMLRPADFTPFQSLRHYGERLLHGGVDRRDVIQSAVLAATCAQTYGAYHIVRQDPFTEEDVQAYAASPLKIWEKVYLGAAAIIKLIRCMCHIEFRYKEEGESRTGFLLRFTFSHPAMSTTIEESGASGGKLA